MNKTTCLPGSACCRDAVIGLSKGALLQSPEFRDEDKRVTVELVYDYVELTKPLVARQGHNLDGLGDDIPGLVEMEFNIQQAEPVRLDGRESEHLPWLDDRKVEIFGTDSFWSHYRAELSNKLPPQPVNRLDEVTDQILDSLEDPLRPGQWDRRGLVMGHVQSGKTNNYVGLICKAADAGYKVIIVLAGLHNNLRAQTQTRIDEGFLGRDTSKGAMSMTQVGVGKYKGHRHVNTMTSALDTGDFSKATASMNFASLKVPTVFVVKKNVSVLRNLYEWISANSEKPAGYERVPKVPLLLVDDEADSASIDVSNDDPETDPSATNLAIRKILNHFDQTSYVAYTATPFANVLIDNKAEHVEAGEDLFPRSFIVGLNAPSNYVGPQRVFGVPDDDPNAEAPPLVRLVDDAEDWVPSKHNKALEPSQNSFPESLKDAISSFAITLAVRRVRGHESHNSMLVHVTRFVDVQERVRSQIADYVLEISAELRNNSGSDGPCLERIRRLWFDDYETTNESLGDDNVSAFCTFEEMQSELLEAIVRIKVVTVNGSAQEALTYDTETSKSVIAIGGEKLSRGLTLEGLSISYYLRSTRMYDTLMQMGRWFGYRPDYLDLCRIYTTADISQWYQAIAAATNDLLEQFAEMEAAGSTPAEFGLRVRHSPGLMVTSRTKMKDGTRRLVSFSDSRPEVTTFSTRKSDREQNVADLETLVLDLGKFHSETDSQYKWSDVESTRVIAYLNRLGDRNAYSSSKSAEPKYLAKYIEKGNERECLTKWTVVIKSKAATQNRKVIGGLDVGLVKRTNVVVGPGESDEIVNDYAIKSLIGSADESLDLDDELRERVRREGLYGTKIRSLRKETNGLIIFYLLEGDRTPAGEPFVAYCISFPNDPNGDKIEYVVNNVYEDQQ